MKIYFAGSIRGGRDDVNSYLELINHIKNYGQVLTEHVGDSNLITKEEGLSEKQIHDRDLEWLKECDYLIAEVTIPNLGVGYEIAKAIQYNKKVLCLFRPNTGKLLSAMVQGCSDITVKEYINIEEAKKIISNFLK